MATCVISASKHVVTIQAPFRAGFLEALKELVPRGERFWDAQKKVWEVYPEHLDDVVELARSFFSDVIVEEWDSEIQRSKGEDVQKAWRELEKAKAEFEKQKREFEAQKRRYRPNTNGVWSRIGGWMGKEELKKLRRILAARYHPDRGGSHEKMVEINKVFDDLLN